MPQLASNWPDLLSKDFTKIYFDRYQQIPVMVPDLFNVMTSDAAYEKTSAVGTVPDFVEFTGRVSEVIPAQEYDKQYVFTEYAAKIEIQRKLAADDLLKLVVYKLGELLEPLILFRAISSRVQVYLEKVQRLVEKCEHFLITTLAPNTISEDIVHFS